MIVESYPRDLDEGSTPHFYLPLPLPGKTASRLVTPFMTSEVLIETSSLF